MRPYKGYKGSIKGIVGVLEALSVGLHMRHTLKELAYAGLCLRIVIMRHRFEASTFLLRVAMGGKGFEFISLNQPQRSVGKPMCANEKNNGFVPPAHHKTLNMAYPIVLRFEGRVQKKHGVLQNIVF